MGTLLLGSYGKPNVPNAHDYMAKITTFELHE